MRFRRSAARSGGRITAEMPSGAGTSAIGPASSIARAVGDDALRRAQEKGIVEQSAQAAEPMADRRARQVHPIGRAADVTLLQHGLEQNQEASADMVALALIERAHVEVGGLPAQDSSA